MIMRIEFINEDNSILYRAFKVKNDEFYTKYEDIEREIPYYKEYLKDKAVYCNCDNPFKSNFFFYFLDNFNEFGLKKLICSGLNSLEVEILRIEKRFSGKDIIDLMRGLKKRLTRDKTSIIYSDKAITIKLGKDKEGNYSYSSIKSLELLKECDIVITNPPFSKIRDYIELLFEFKKDFIIIGSNLIPSLKNIFPRIEKGIIKLGVTGIKEFINPEGKLKRVQTYWYSTFSPNFKRPFIKFRKIYNKKDYPEYKNFKAINVNSVRDIPDNYFGVMGVPLNFFEKYNSRQFRLKGIATESLAPEELKKKYIPKNKNIKTCNAIIEVNGKEKNTFTRVLIQRIR